MTDRGQFSFSRWLERAMLLVLVLYISFHIMPRAWKSLITDFPNYYTAAQLAHDRFDTSRMYEWQWIEREKDHRGLPIRVIGMVPLTPFSTLFMWPLIGLKALTAKRVWIVFSLALLLPMAWMLRAMTGLNYRRIALFFFVNAALYRNLEDGQFYVLLLFLIIAACFAWMRQRPALAGALVAIAAASKIFPLLLFVFFFNRRSWRALISGVIAGAATLALSIAAFGWSVHRTYLHEVLPAAMHGEAMPPYLTNASISGILHVLFLSEPEWNPKPWHNSVLSFSILMPLVSMLLLAPAILLIDKDNKSPQRMLLEWSALLTAALTVSTEPASYNFVLMALPLCAICARLLERRQYVWLAAALIAYVGIGFPFPVPPRLNGLAILMHTPRLPLMIAVLLGIYALLWTESPLEAWRSDWMRLGWVAAMTLSIVLSAHSAYLRERAMRDEYAYRLPIPSPAYLNADPKLDGGALRYIAFTLDGYRLMQSGGPAAPGDTHPDPIDELSFTTAEENTLVERAGTPESDLIGLQNPAFPLVRDAHDPVLSTDAQSLAFLREDHGRNRLLVRRAIDSDDADQPLTEPALNVYEASFLSEKQFAFAASDGGRPPQIYLTDASHRNAPLGLGESRYPALSPDRRWLVYSHLEHGAWNLWIRDQGTGEARRIGDVPCNEIEPSWESDSKTLLYSTDCGRSLWFTAIAQRKVIP